MYIKRNLEDTIINTLSAPEIIAVVGPRRSGKTTLITKIVEKLDKSVFLTFENKDILDKFNNNIDDFIIKYVKPNKYLFIDEFQYAKEGGQKLKYIFDTQKTKIIISGSSNIDLTVQAIKYLVGRILIFNLYPLDFKEFLSFKNNILFKKYVEIEKDFHDFNLDTKFNFNNHEHQKLKTHYEEYLLFGGYPRVVTEDKIEMKKLILKNIYDTYFLREVKDIMGLIDDYKLSNVIKAFAFQIGNLIEYKELSKLSGYSFNSLKKYINFLEKTYVIKLVRPYFRNKRTEIVKNPKVYFIDTGLRNLIVNNFNKILERDDKGSLLENGLLQQFMKKEYEINFWRDKKKNEIDFIISLEAGRKIAIESKNRLKYLNYPSGKIFSNKYKEIDILYGYFEKNKDIKNNNNYPIYLF